MWRNVDHESIAAHFGYSLKRTKQAIFRLDSTNFINIVKLVVRASVSETEQINKVKKEIEAAKKDREKYKRLKTQEPHLPDGNTDVSQEILDMLSPEVRKILEDSNELDY